MLGERSLEKIFFSFLCQVTSSTPKNHPITLLCMVCYTVLLLPMLSITTYSSSNLGHMIFQTPFLLIITTTLMSIILIQIIIGSLYNIHFQLYHQLTLYRYVLNPIILILLAKEIHYPHYFPVIVALSLMAIIAILAYLISALFLQPFTFNRLMKNTINMSKFLTISDCFLVLTASVSNNSTQFYLLLCFWLCFAVLFINIPKIYDLQDFTLTILSFVYLLKFVLMFVLLGKNTFFTSQ